MIVDDNDSEDELLATGHRYLRFGLFRVTFRLDSDFVTWCGWADAGVNAGGLLPALPWAIVDIIGTTERSSWTCGVGFDGDGRRP